MGTKGKSTTFNYNNITNTKGSDKKHMNFAKLVVEYQHQFKYK